MVLVCPGDCLAQPGLQEGVAAPCTPLAPELENCALESPRLCCLAPAPPRPPPIKHFLLVVCEE